MTNKEKNKLITVLTVVINVFFVFGLFFAEFQYISTSRTQTIAKNEENFLNTNISLASMTNNYLVGESHLCRSWSNYLNANVQSIDDAMHFLKESITDTDVMGHIVYKANFSGYSTRANVLRPSDYSLDYSLISDKVFTQDIEGVRVSSSYINPINGSPSIAFYSDIKLIDPNDASQEVDAYLLRVVLRDDFKERWTFPNGTFRNLQVTIMDNDGDYIIAGKSFEFSNFFEFYKSYNKFTDQSINELMSEVTTNNGLFKMYNADGQECYIAYSHFTNSVDWIILTYTPQEDITTVTIDWLLISILGVGLAALFIIDVAFLLVLNKHLVETASVADSANKAKTDFLSMMSHDIRTPMNAIIGLTEIAKNEQNNPSSTQDALKKIELASNHLLTLINDILDLSKIESGKLNINPLDFSIVEMFDNIVNITLPNVKSKNIDFSFRVHDFSREWLFADKLRLSQIFSNLLSNAVKYTLENGKVFVDVYEEESAKEGCIKLLYRVEDTGIGMAPEYVAKMYEPFSRATDSRVNSIQGTGLGLSITKRMVDLMGGTIDCESEVGKGTIFTVILDIPLSEKQNDEVKLPEIDILVVDEDEKTLDVAFNSLTSLGAKVSVSSSRDQALEMLEERKDNQYEIVIVDYKTLSKNECDLIEKINSISSEKSPKILVSVYEMTEVKEIAEKSGIAGYISKPLFRSKLYEKIMEVMNLEVKSDRAQEEKTNFDDINVLVVEDNEINWEIISSLLEMHGIKSDRAQNGKVALDLLTDKNNDNKRDIIFMDIQMPVMNGLDATRGIRKIGRAYTKNVPIVAMTADAFSENVTECLEAGMNGHIAKPIDLNIVLNEIRKVAAKKK